MSRLEFAKKQIKKYPEERKILLNDIPDWVIIGKNVYIGKHVVFSDTGCGYVKIDGKYTHIPHVGKVIIEDNVEIHDGTHIVRATSEDGVTKIGDGTIVSHQCMIAHNVKIGKDCYIVNNTSIAGSAEIGDNCFLGVGTLVKNKIKIGDNVIVGMGSVVVNNIESNITICGNPAKNLDKNDNK